MSDDLETRLRAVAAQMPFYITAYGVVGGDAQPREYIFGENEDRWTVLAAADALAQHRSEHRSRDLEPVVRELLSAAKAVDLSGVLIPEEVGTEVAVARDKFDALLAAITNAEAALATAQDTGPLSRSPYRDDVVFAPGTPLVVDAGVTTGETVLATAGEPLRHIDEWHEDHGSVLWWTNPVTEPPYVGSPLDCGRAIEVVVDGEVFIAHVGGWPGYHEWWTPLPPAPQPNTGDER